MKVIIPKDAKKPPKSAMPSYSIRRKLKKEMERATGRDLSTHDVKTMILMHRLKSGDFGADDAKILSDMGVAHYDNAEKFPDGTEVKLNYVEISKRKHTDFTEEYWQWIEEHKDDVFHLEREENAESLVCLAEDERYRDMDGERVRIPRWKFDLFSDLLVNNGEDEFVSPWDIPDSTEDFVEIGSDKE